MADGVTPFKVDFLTHLLARGEALNILHHCIGGVGNSQLLIGRLLIDCSLLLLI
jgi:protein-tyrosine phosphatase